MEMLNKKISKAVERPIKVLQFGEGNFLRGFVDYMIDVANEKTDFNGSIVVVKPISFGNLDRFHAQECQYTMLLRGLVDGKETQVERVVTSITEAVDPYSEYEKYTDLAKLESLRFIVSNTTEAGIVYDETDSFETNPSQTYPGKLTKFLLDRYKAFNGDVTKGLIILPVELIDDNGIELKKCVLKFVELWNLEAGFLTWLNEACIFCSTLVDRIVTGYPADEAKELCDKFGYQDELINTGEPFGLWVIESDKSIQEEFPLDKAGMPVIFTDNQKPYKQRKVRILNGAHTSFVLMSYLAGNDFVLESMQDGVVKEFMTETIFEEVIPTLTLPEEELKEFAAAVIDRFENPFIKHSLLSISLNSVSKWRARCLPSLLGYVEKFEKLPKNLTFSIASLIAFYNGTKIEDRALIGSRNKQEYKVMDDAAVLEFFAANSEKLADDLVDEFLSKEEFWGCDLTAVKGLYQAVVNHLVDIRNNGMRKAVETLMKK
jgi:Mannitol-1-phosphate/altronate dehydrogenases